MPGWLQTAVGASIEPTGWDAKVLGTQQVMD